MSGAENQVRTVLGDVPSSELGMCFAHEHLVIDGGVAKLVNPEISLQRVSDAVAELAPCVAAGLGTVSGVLFAFADDIPEISALDRYRPNTITRLSSAQGSVIGEEFVGATLRLYADAGSQQEIRLLTSYDARASSITASSQRIALSWNISDAYVLPE